MKQQAIANMRAYMAYDQEAVEESNRREEKWRRDSLIKHCPEFNKDEIEKMNAWELKIVMDRLDELKKQKEADSLIQRMKKATD